MTLPLLNSHGTSSRPASLALSQQICGSSTAHSSFGTNPELPSPSDTPRFNGPVPILKPFPTSKPGSRPQLGKLNINSGMGSIPLFQHVAGPQRIDDVMDESSTISPEERTIRPQEGDNSDSSEHKNSGCAENPSLEPDVGSVCSRAHAGHGTVGNGNVGLPKTREFICPPSSSRRASFLMPSATQTQISDQTSNGSQTKQFSDGVLEELDRLGEGAGGAVHKVRDRRDGEIYACKTITTGEVAMKQVLRELNVVCNICHPNIVPCFGAYEPTSNEVKIVMEYCDGGSLEVIGKKIKEIGGVIGEKITGRLAEGILRGLSHLHSQRTIHRDIKPSNILLSREGIVKLCDFGVSGELVESSVNTFTGTLLYMAPERISGGIYTMRSDVWSLGISLLELVKNRFPFTFPPNAPAFEVVLTISKGQPPRLEDEPEAGITWSEEMKNFISQALTVDPTMRPTPAAMLEHRWITNTMKQDVDMSRWICQVWGWPKPRSH